jgi:hypothetical protein
MKKMLFFGLGLISLVVLNVFGVPYLFDGVQTNGKDTLATLTGLRSSTSTSDDQDTKSPELPTYDVATKFWLHEVKDGQLGAEIGDPNAFNSPEWDFGNVKQVTEFNSDADSVAFVVQITALELLDTTKLLGLAKKAYDASAKLEVYKDSTESHYLNDTTTLGNLAGEAQRLWSKVNTTFFGSSTNVAYSADSAAGVALANTNNKDKPVNSDSIVDAYKFARTAWKQIQGLGFKVANAPTLTVQNIVATAPNPIELYPRGGYVNPKNSPTSYHFLQAKSKNELITYYGGNGDNITIGDSIKNWGVVTKVNQPNTNVFAEAENYVVAPSYLEDNFPAFYAIYFVSAKDVANINLRVGVKWKGKSSWYGDAESKKKVNISPDTRQDSTTFTFEISKSDKLAEISTLDDLHLVVLSNALNEPKQEYNQDLGEDLLSGFSKDVFNYTARPIELEKKPYLYIKPSRTGVEINVKYNGAEKPFTKNGVSSNDTTISKIATSWAYFELPNLSGDVEIKVTSANGLSSKTYKLSYKQLLSKAPDDYKIAVSSDTVTVSAHLLEYLYVKYGSDTVKLYRETDGTIFDGTIRSQEADNAFIASVPDPNNSDVSILSKYWSKFEYNATVRDK